MDQGSENADGDMSNSSIPGNTRWNPTKEQITLLEGLYKQGIRTPTAEQIQQITARLKVFGHIEGKNVFYWFQNHKARQRQKQKQENMAYFKSYFHKPSPLAVGFPPPNCPNVVCGPYYLPQSELGFYQQYTKVLHPGGIQRSPMPTYKGLMLKEGSKQETLPLFPLEPTGVLQAARVSTNSSLASNSSTPSSSSEIDETCGDQPSFFDFFSGNGSYESD